MPAFALSGGASDIRVMRIMCRRGFSIDMASLFVRDFKAAVAFFETHPASAIHHREGTGFHH